MTNKNEEKLSSRNFHSGAAKYQVTGDTNDMIMEERKLQFSVSNTEQEDYQKNEF